jgi:hypothetical protein
MVWRISAATLGELRILITGVPCAMYTIMMVR